MFAFVSPTAGRNAAALLGSVAAAFICLGAAAGPANAAPAIDDAPRTVEVSVDGLDLNSAKGQEMLQARLRAAARAVCDNGAVNAMERIEKSRCMQGALEEATTPLRFASSSTTRG